MDDAGRGGSRPKSLPTSSSYFLFVMPLRRIITIIAKRNRKVCNNTNYYYNDGYVMKRERERESSSFARPRRQTGKRPLVFHLFFCYTARLADSKQKTRNFLFVSRQ